MAEFFQMGGYAGYVWPSYAISAIVLTALFIATWRGLKSRERLLETLKATRGSRRRREASQAGAPQSGGAEPGGRTGQREEITSDP